MQFQSHDGQCVERCLRCGAMRKLSGIRDYTKSVGDDFSGFWELFPSYLKCSGHSWIPVSA